jgi:hypothetical protein
MSGKPAASNPEKAPRALARAIVWVAAIFLAISLLLALALYLLRMPVAALLAQRYFAELGIPSEIAFSELSRTHTTLRVRLGDPSNADFTAETFSATLEFPSLFSMPAVTKAQIEGGRLKLAYDGAKMSFGALAPLLGLGGSGGPVPDVTIKGSTLVAETPFGMLSFTVDAEAKNGRLVRLDAKLNPSTAKSGTFSASLSEGSIKANEIGETLDITLSLAVANAVMAETQATGIQVSGELRGLTWTMENGAARFHLQRAELAADASEITGNGFSSTKPSLRFRTGAAEGSSDNGRITALAPLDAEITAGETAAGGARFNSVSANFASAPATITAQEGRYALSGPTRVRSTLKDTSFEGAAAETINIDIGSESATADYSNSGWSISGATHTVIDGATVKYALTEGTAQGSARAEFDGPMRMGSTAATANLTGSVTGNATLQERAARALAGSVPLLNSDPAFITALATSLRSISLNAPAIGIAHENSETSLSLNAPITASGAGGAKLSLARAGNSPAMRMTKDATEGAISLDISGKGLPQARVAISSYRAAGDDFSASATIDARLDYRDMHGIRVSGPGELRANANGVSVLAPRCADIQLASFTPGGFALAGDSQGQFCAASGKPLFALQGNTWRLDGQWTIPRAPIALLAANLSAGQGTVGLRGTAAGLTSGEFELARGILTDGVTPARFNSIGAGAKGTITSNGITSRIGLTSKQTSFANIVVTQSLATGNGTAEIDASMLSFAPARLQPTDISPMLTALGTRFTGTANFTGKFAWENGTVTSGGRFTTTGMGFTGPAGEVRNAAATIDFSSLLPFAAESGQKFTAARIESFVPMENVSASFAFTQQAVRLEAASATIGGGKMSVDPMTYVFSPDAVTQGTLHLSSIDVTPLLEAGGLGGRVSAKARIGGIVPFSMGPEGLRFANGRIEAEPPGRIAIKREALTGSADVGAAGTAPPNAIQDFAYQAMENLAFDKLDATVDSVANGRLGVLFHIVGRHDPEVAGDARLPVAGLIRGTAFEKPIPLPKGTPVDLRLDTSLNLDELLAVYFGRQTAMAPPQSPVTMGPK